VKCLRSGACDVPADPFGAHARELASIRRPHSGAHLYSAPALGCLRCACGPIRRLRSGACGIGEPPIDGKPQSAKQQGEASADDGTGDPPMDEFYDQNSWLRNGSS
jgi:hypothetical protein